MITTITYRATSDVDGQVQGVSNSESVESQNVASGVQTVGTTYEPIVAALNPVVGLFIYNTGAVDVSVRLTLDTFSVNEYHFINLIAGGIIAVPPVVMNDLGYPTLVNDINARTDSGTADLEYCLIL
jgi:hypothetical protein